MQRTGRFQVSHAFYSPGCVRICSNDPACPAHAIAPAAMRRGFSKIVVRVRGLPWLQPCAHAMLGACKLESDCCYCHQPCRGDSRIATMFRAAGVGKLRMCLSTAHLHLRVSIYAAVSNFLYCSFHSQFEHIEKSTRMCRDALPKNQDEVMLARFFFHIMCVCFFFFCHVLYPK